MLRVFRSISLVVYLVLGASVGVLVEPTAARAADGTKFEIDFFEQGSAQPMNHATVWVSARRIRVEQHGPGEPIGPVLIYRGDRDMILTVSDRERSYAKIERQILSLLTGEARRARRQIENQTQGLPKDQQKAFDRLLGISRQDPNMASNPVVVSEGEQDALRVGLETGQGEVAGFRCKHVEMKRTDFIVGKACVASWEAVGMTASDLEVFRALAHFQRDAMGSRALSPMELVPDQPLDLIAQFGGLPLAYSRTLKGKEYSSIQVVSIEHLRVADDALFEVPTGYARNAGYGAFVEHLAPGKTRARPTTQAAALPAAPALESSIDRAPSRATASEEAPVEIARDSADARRVATAPKSVEVDEGSGAVASDAPGKSYTPRKRRTKATRKPKTRLIRLF